MVTLVWMSNFFFIESIRFLLGDESRCMGYRAMFLFLNNSLELFANKNLSRLLYFVILVQDVNQDKWYVMS